MAFSNGLDVAIGLVFIYILLSLLATTVSEVIESSLKSRGVYCLRALAEMFDTAIGTNTSGGAAYQPINADPNNKATKTPADLLVDFFSHPFVYALYSGATPVEATKPVDGKGKPALPAVKVSDKNALPSYVPASNFSRTVIYMVLGEAVDLPKDLTAIRSAVDTWPAGRFKDAVIACLAEASGDIEKAKALLEAWYNACMDRASGWYKRHKQTLLLIGGFVACGLFNVNSVHIAQSLYNDATLRAAIVAEAQVASKNGLDALKGSCDKPAIAAKDNRDASASASASGLAADTASEVASSATLSPAETSDVASGGPDSIGSDSASGSDVGQKIQAVQCFNQKLVDLKLPIGWDDSAVKELKANWVWFLLMSVIGWAVTAFAITLGAPFWFDLLNKLVNLRSTFKPEEVKQAQGQGQAAGRKAS